MRDAENVIIENCLNHNMEGRSDRWMDGWTYGILGGRIDSGTPLSFMAGLCGLTRDVTALPLW